MCNFLETEIHAQTLTILWKPKTTSMCELVEKSVKAGPGLSRKDSEVCYGMSFAHVNACTISLFFLVPYNSKSEPGDYPHSNEFCPSTSARLGYWAYSVVGQFVTNWRIEPLAHCNRCNASEMPDGFKRTTQHKITLADGPYWHSKTHQIPYTRELLPSLLYPHCRYVQLLRSHFGNYSRGGLEPMTFGSLTIAGPRLWGRYGGMLVPLGPAYVQPWW